MKQLLELFDDLEIVGEAGSGEEAIDHVARCQPDIILMDVGMEGQGGVAATQAIRKLWPQGRIILLTTYKQYVVRGIEAGACGYVLKKTDEETLVKAIHIVYQGDVYFDPQVQNQMVRGIQGDSLTKREISVLNFAKEGKENREIGELLGLSEVAIKKEFGVIREKLGASNRTHAVAIALERGLI